MADNLFDLSGKTAVVVGGTTGIGRAISLGFARAGATVVASSRRQDTVEAVASELESLGSRTLRIPSDVTDRASLEKLRDAVKAEFSSIDILCVTAGSFARGPSVEMPESEFQRVVEVNLTGSFRTNQVFGSLMIEQGKGSIINTASMTSFVSFANVAPYACSKAGVKMLTETLAVEWAPLGVRVNAIAPGVFRTALNSDALDVPERHAAIINRTPMGRLGQLDELVGAAVYLGSDAAKFVTGVTIPVDGGFLAKGI